MRFKFLVSAFVGLLIALQPSAAMALDNAGTIKVTEDSTCATSDNNPKVESPFYVGVFGFEPEETISIVIATQPGGVEVFSGSDITDINGFVCSGPITLEPGSYKVEVTDSKGKKSKVFQEVTKPQSPTPSPTSSLTPTPTPTLTPSPTTSSAPIPTVRPTQKITPSSKPIPTPTPTAEVEELAATGPVSPFLATIGLVLVASGLSMALGSRLN